MRQTTKTLMRSQVSIAAVTLVDPVTYFKIISMSKLELRAFSRGLMVYHNGHDISKDAVNTNSSE
jgi:hypothetical protein